MSGKRSATSSTGQAASILFDGWPMVYAPGGPAALHLLELIEALPAQYPASLALPGALDAGMSAALGAARTAGALLLDVRHTPTPNTTSGRIQWEQRALPALCGQGKTRVLHTTSRYPPLNCPVPVVVSPVEDISHRPAPAAGLVNRLRDALGQGGFSRVSAVLWPADLPAPDLPAPVHHFPLHMHSAFGQPQLRRAHLPESYLFAPAPPDAAALELLAAAWSWVSAGLGEDWALLASGLDARALDQLRALSRQAGASGPVERVTTGTPEEQAAVFQHAGALFLVTQPQPWADAFIHALACGRPLVAEATLLADARVGPAGYLTTPGDARALGAAALTIIVEENLAEQLTRAAEARVNEWQSQEFSARLCALYDQL